MKISNALGRSLDTLLVAPENMHAGVVLCHGFLSEKANVTHASICAQLVQSGIGVLTFDFTGHGKSEGSLFHVASAHDFFYDLVAIMNYAHSVFPKTALYGASLGGYIATQYSAQFPVAALALKCPLVDPRKSWPSYREKRFSQVPENIRSALTQKITSLVENIPPLYTVVTQTKNQTYVVGAAYDEFIDRHDIIALAAKLRVPCTFLQGDHDFSEQKEHDKMVFEISNWLIGALAHHGR